MNASLYRSPNAAGSWTQIGGAAGYSLQTIYGVNGQLLAGGSNNGNWKIFYTNGSSNLAELSNSSGQLSGVAFAGSAYYISTRGNGIYSTSSLPGTLSSVTGTANKDVTGIISVKSAVTAVTWNGEILKQNGTSFSVHQSGGPHYTGGMTAWSNGSGSLDQLLLLGVHSDSSYKKAYREVTLDGSGAPTSGPLDPGTGNPSTISSNDISKYEASIARYSVYFIFQAPNDPTIFASTATNGLYRQKDGLWNAQD
jgi:hypothetical protein